MRLNPGSFTVATESTEGTEDKRKELFTVGLLRDQFFLFFLGDNIGLITSDKIITFVPLHDFHLKLPTPSLKKLED